MGLLVRAVQTGIGLAAELKAASKERKASETNAERSLSGELVLSNQQPEDMQCSRLQIHKDPVPTLGEQQQPKGKNDETDHEDVTSEDDEHFGGGAFIPESDSGTDDPKDAPPPYTEEELKDPTDVKVPELNIQALKSSKLQCPVVIPQRRPGSKTRGFIRAYAPVLSNHDIDQETFLTFLKSFHKASQASPILNVITVGAGALGNVPEPFSMLVGLGISALSASAAEIQGRYRTNSFLDQANENLFKPRGLFCLVMAFRPEAVPKGDVAMEPVDTSKAALKWLNNPPTSTFKTYTNSLRNSSDTTRGEIELPETAPLIYPDTGYSEISKTKNSPEQLRQNGKATTGDGKRSAFAQHKKVAENYFDKRAQAKYAHKHPDSALATETTPQFASKYGDPTHPSVTNGYVGRASAAMRKESLEERQTRRRRAEVLQSQQQFGTTVRRFLPPSVLYLMIVNLPTEKELEEASQAITTNEKAV